MLTRKGYRIPEFLAWTRRNIYILLVLSAIPIVLYQVVGIRWLAIPWGIVFLLGTTVALSAGFKNLQTYNRMQDAQQVWGSIASSSRIWGVMVRELVADPSHARALVYGHFAWLAALRHEMRRHQPWETYDKPQNVEYRRHYEIPERSQTLASELGRYLPAEDAAPILASRSAALQALALQGRKVKHLLDEGAITANVHADLQKSIRDFVDLQGRSERIKNYPYPRQHAFINSVFVWILCILMPFGMISELAQMDEAMTGAPPGAMIWLAIPLSLLIGWMYTSLDQVGSSTENPFEGGANDVPISRICEEIEVDLREILGEIELPSLAVSKSGITM